MGIRHDVKQGLEKYEITKIKEQPKDEDLNLLTKELTNAAGSVATQNGGREHGHVGMVVDEAEYITFSKNGTKFWSRRTQDLTQLPSTRTKSSKNNISRNTRLNELNTKPISVLRTTFAG
jgi:hypothetical protein